MRSAGSPTIAAKMSRPQANSKKLNIHNIQYTPLRVGGRVLVDAVVGEVHVHVAHARTVIAVLVRSKPKRNVKTQNKRCKQ